MGEDVEGTLESLKQRFRVHTDQGLADRLSLGRSTVTSWRRRGAVPERYTKLAEQVLTFPPDFLNPAWSETEKAALTLALVRFAKDVGADLSDYSRFLQMRLSAKLAVGVEKALIDLLARMTEAGIEDATQCLNLMVFEEFFSSK